MQVCEVTSDDPRLVPLVAALRAELDARYPEEISFAHPTMKAAARYLLVLVDGEVAGCCAVQPLEGTQGELKRMYVTPAMRGRGIAGRLVVEAEALGRRVGLTRIRLETGVRQPEAIAVYERAGFTRIENFAPYDGWGMSVCYAKSLDAAT